MIKDSFIAAVFSQPHNHLGHRRLSAFCLLLAIAWFAAQPKQAGAKPLLPSFNARAEDQQLTRPRDVPGDAELEASGAIIGEVFIHVQNIFNTESEEENATLFRLGNRLHIKTREATVRQRLLFKPGDRYSGRRLAETERILRAAPQLDDAWIRPVRYHDGEVDIEVTTRDVWTLNPGISFGRSGGKNTSGFELEERNLLGYGSQLSLSYRNDIDRDSVNFHFEDPNLGASWWKLELEYNDKSDGKGGAISLEHPFFSLETTAAYGGSFRQDRRTEYRYDLGKIVDRYAVDEQIANLYYGWSKGLENHWVKRSKIGITLDEHDFSPLTGSLPTQSLPENRKLAYPWISWEWIEENYLKEKNRQQIRRTEDLSLGWTLRASLGYADKSFGADRNAWLFSASAEKGLILSPRQTLLAEASLSGRLESGRERNVVISEKLRYYFRQSPRRLSYVALATDYAIEQDADMQILLGGDNGLRGYPLRYQGGEGRWLLTVEQRFYSNWYPFRLFHVGAAIFADAGATWGDNPYGTESQGVLRDVGFGLRLGNSRSALGRVAHVDFAFPLDGGDDISSFQFLLHTERSF